MTEQEIEEKIQKIIHYLIPTNWKVVKLFASKKDTRTNKKGELYFYYQTNQILNRNYINCYEIPSIYNIDEMEFNNLIAKLYNYILILGDYHIKNYDNNWNQITITIEKKGIFKVETNSYPFSKIPFSSYEMQVIWRYLNLKLGPVTKEEKNIIAQYLKSSFSKSQKATKVSKVLKVKGKNILEYDKVLSIDEILARKINLEEKYDKINDSENLNYIGKQFNNIKSIILDKKDNNDELFR